MNNTEEERPSAPVAVFFLATADELAQLRRIWYNS